MTATLNTRTALLAACSDLFTRYPQAAKSIDDSGTVRSMVLLLAEGDDARFFILNSQDDGEGPFFNVGQWRGTSCVDLDDETAQVPDWAVDAVTRGMPVPRNGSLFGWVDQGRITAVIPFYAHYTPETPEPIWSLMPDVDLAEDSWPPFTGEHLLGPWLWEHFHAGRIVDLAPLVAESPGAVFWVNTAETIGSDSAAVAHDLASPAGWILPRGRYVHFECRDGAPSLDGLLADPGKTDLAPRFLTASDPEEK